MIGQDMDQCRVQFTLRLGILVRQPAFAQAVGDPLPGVALDQTAVLLNPIDELHDLPGG